MLYRSPCLVFLVLLSFAQLRAAEDLTVGTFEVKADLVYQEDFSSDPKKWKSEGRGKVWAENGRLQMDATGVEMTAWCPYEMSGDLLITYEALILDPSDANNINFFFMATGTEGQDVRKLRLSGAYKEYHQLPNYIMTFTAGYTRLRRNPGFNLVSENTEVKALAQTEYELAILIQGNRIRCFINDIPVHVYTEETPLRKGRVAFRSWHTRLWWDNLKIYRVLH
jgi:hypothetical protein